MMVLMKRTPNVIIIKPVVTKTPKRNQNKSLRIDISYVSSAFKRRAVSSGVIEMT